MYVSSSSFGTSLPTHGSTSKFRMETYPSYFSAILDYPYSERREPREHCDCAQCAARREAVFQCSACGFEGRPIVWACDCLSEWEKTVALWSDVVENYDARPHYFNLPRSRYKKWLAHCRSGRPSVPCTDRRCCHT